MISRPSLRPRAQPGGSNPVSFLDCFVGGPARNDEIILSLDRIRPVAEKFIPLSYDCPVVTIAGTNGKGSTVAVLSALAQDAGLNVATYTSPHLYTFNERIQINDKPINDEDLLEALNAVEQARGEVSLTYFENTTLAALYYFHQQKLDLIILEVGMGGRLDATNIIDCDIAIITSIGLDHMEYLGDTKEVIASEKLGIARAGKPLIWGDVSMECPRTDAILYKPALIPTLKTNLVPSNIACAVKAAELLIIPVNLSVIENVRVPGRKQHIRVLDKNVLLDVAHNEDSLNELCTYITSLDFSAFHLVLGVMGDKNFGPALPRLAKLCHSIHLAKPDTPRAMELDTLAGLIPDETFAYHNVETAYHAALDQCRADECVIVTGSFYTIGEGCKEMESHNEENML